MAVTTDSLLATISIDTKAASKNVEALTKSVVGFDASLKNIDGSSKKTEGAVNDIGFSALKLNAIIEVAKKTYEVLIEPIKDVVKAYTDQLDAQMKLANVLQVNGKLTSDAVGDFTEFAKALQDTTATSDDLVLKLAQQAIASGRTIAETKRMISTSVQMAAVQGTVEQAFDALNMSYKGVTRGLSTYRTELKDMSVDQGKAGLGVEILGEQFKGLAEKNLNTFSGQAALAHEKLEDLKKSLGSVVLGALNMDQATGGLAKLFGQLNDYVETNKEEFINLSKFGIKMALDAMDAFGRVANDVLQALDGLIQGITSGLQYAAQGFLKLVVLGEKYGHIGGANDENVKSAEDAYEKMSKSADDHAERAKAAFSTIGNYATSTYEDIFERTEKVAKATDKVSEGAKKAATNYRLIGQEGRGALDELAKKYDEVVTKNAQAGAGDYDLAKSRYALGQHELDQLETKLKKYKALTPQAQMLLDLTRRGLDATKEKEIAAFRQKSLDDILGKNVALAMETDKRHQKTLDMLQLQETAELDVIDRQIESLDKQGQYNGLLKEAIDIEKKRTIAKYDAARKDAPSKEFEGAKQAGEDVAKSINGVMQGGLTGMAGEVSGLITGFGSILDAAQQLIDFIPQMLEKIANIFTSFAQLPTMIAKGIGDVMKGIVKFIVTFIPNLMKAIPDILNTLVTGLFEQIPAAIEKLVASIPTLFDKLIARLPDLITRFVSGLITMMPRIMVALSIGLIKAAPRIAMAMVEVFFIELPKAIIKGIIEGISKLTGLFSNLFGSTKLPELKIDTKSITKALTGAGSKIFSVTDLTNAAAAADKTKEVAKGISDGIQKVIDFLTKVWKELLKLLKAAWDWIYKTFLKPWIDLLMAAWDAITKNLKVLWDSMMAILTAVWDAVKALWDGMIKFLKDTWDQVLSVFNTVINFLKSTWKIITDLFSGKINLLQAVGQFWANVLSTGSSLLNGAGKYLQSIFEFVVNGLTTVANLFKSVGSAMVKPLQDFANSASNIGTMIWDSLKNGLGGLGDWILKQLNGLNPANLLSKMFTLDGGGRGTVEKALGIDVPYVAFAKGGIVPGDAVFRGDSPINDRILAMVSPGEAVIPRSKMNQPEIREIVRAIMDGSISLPKFWSVKAGPVSVGSDGVKVNDKSPGEALGDLANSIKDGGRSLGDRATDLGKALETGGANAWEQVKDVAQEVWDNLAKMDPTQLWKIVKDKVWDGVWQMITHSKFHDGGMVPGYSGGSMDVPAMLQTGEFVVKRNAVNQLGPDALHHMNRTGRLPTAAGPSATTINISMPITTTQPVDDNLMRNKILPAFREELKRMSLDGKFVISSKGVRTT